MNNSTEQRGRIQVGNLTQREKELNEKEAENVKGGGGPSGGVNERAPGEEIPQRNRN